MKLTNPWIFEAFRKLTAIFPLTGGDPRIKAVMNAWAVELEKYEISTELAEKTVSFCICELKYFPTIKDFLDQLGRAKSTVKSDNYRKLGEKNPTDLNYFSEEERIRFEIFGLIKNKFYPDEKYSMALCKKNGQIFDELMDEVKNYVPMANSLETYIEVKNRLLSNYSHNPTS